MDGERIVDVTVDTAEIFGELYSLTSQTSRITIFLRGEHGIFSSVAAPRSQGEAE